MPHTLNIRQILKYLDELGSWGVTLKCTMQSGPGPAELTRRTLSLWKTNNMFFSKLWDFPPPPTHLLLFTGSLEETSTFYRAESSKQ